MWGFVKEKERERERVCLGVKESAEFSIFLPGNFVESILGGLLG